MVARGVFIDGIGGISGALESNERYLSPDRLSGDTPLAEDEIFFLRPRTVPSLLRPLRFSGRLSGTMRWSGRSEVPVGE